MPTYDPDQNQRHRDDPVRQPENKTLEGTQKPSEPEDAHATPGGVRAALVAAQGEMDAVRKGERNQHGGFDYASREDISRAAKVILAKHGLAFGLRGPVKVTDTTATFMAVLTHKGGQQEQWPVVWVVDYARKGMTKEQRLGSAMSYAMKNELLAVFNIPRGDPQADIDSQPQGHSDPGARAHQAVRGNPKPRQPERDPEILRMIDELTAQDVVDEVRIAAKARGLTGSLKAQDDDTIRALHGDVIPPV